LEPLPRRLFERRRDVYFCQPPPSWAHERTPKMGALWQELLLSPPAARVGRIGGTARKAYMPEFYGCACTTPVFSGRIKLPISAQAEMCDLSSSSLQSGNTRGNAWASFLSPFLCDEAKKWHPCRYSAARSSTKSRWAVRASKEEVV